MKFLKFALMLMLTSAVIVACDDDDDDNNNNDDVVTLLAPTGVEATVVDGRSVELSWNAVEGAAVYKIELAANGDLNFGGTLLHEISTKTSPYLIENLDSGESFSIRIRAVGNRQTLPSEWVEKTFTTEVEQLFKEVRDEDLTDTEVTLRWEAGPTATKIVLTPGDITYTLDVNDLAIGEVTITGLEEGTEYTAKLYNNDRVRGTVTFTTLVGIEGTYISTTECRSFTGGSSTEYSGGTVVITKESDNIYYVSCLLGGWFVEKEGEDDRRGPGRIQINADNSITVLEGESIHDGGEILDYGDCYYEPATGNIRLQVAYGAYILISDLSKSE
ncbi:DUF5012 domain-containing protein [Odoribacter sp. OttesenSCG-928-J03]|nr:DUF5012 domain-containing protein [Odoribacter sp. OttesenSCG-928-J03]